MDEQTEADAKRWRWLRAQYAKGKQTYFAETCSNSETKIDEEIDLLIHEDSAEGGT